MDDRGIEKNVTFSREQLAAFCQKHGIRRLAIFGLALRDDFHPDSDIDDVLWSLIPFVSLASWESHAWSRSYLPSWAAESKGIM